MKKFSFLLGLISLGLFSARAESTSVYQQYLNSIGDSTDYKQVQDMRREILSRTDLSMEQKKNLSHILTQRYNANIDNESNREIQRLHRNEMILRGISSISFQGVYWTSVVFFPGTSKYTSMLDTWGRGILDEKSGKEIVIDIGTGLLLSHAANKLDGLIKGTKEAKAFKALPSKMAEYLSKTKGGEKALKMLKSLNLAHYQDSKKEAEVIRKWAEDVLTKPDSKLSAAEKLRKDIAKKLSSKLEDYAKKNLKDKSTERVVEEMLDDVLSTARGRIDDWAIDKLKEDLRGILKKQEERPTVEQAYEFIPEDVDEYATRNENAKTTTAQGYEFKSEYAGEYAVKNESTTTTTAQGYEFLPEYANPDTPTTSPQNQEPQANSQLPPRGVQRAPLPDITADQIAEAMEQLRKSEGDNGVTLPSDAPLNNADTSDPKEVALSEWKRQLAELGKDMSAEDRDQLQQAADAIRREVEEGIKRGEEWAKDGGPRDQMQKVLDNVLDGKVSDADKARIKNLADKLCNIGQDNGRSFAEALGKDGEPLLRSLAVQQLQNEISKSLPKDVADNVNNYIQMLAIDGYDFLDPATKQQMLDTVKSAIAEYLPYETSATTLNTLLQDIYDGKSVDVLDAAKDLGNSIAVDALRDAIKKNMDPEAAGPLLAALDGYVQSGFKVPGAVQGGLDALIDKYAPGAESAAELKKVLSGVMDGTATLDDIRRASSAVFADKMKATIDASDLSPEAKRAAKDAIDVLKQNGITGITAATETFINDYVTDKLGPEAGKAASDIFHALVTPGADPWAAVKGSLSTIAKSIGTKILAKVEALAVKQLNAFINKHPVLKEIFGALGIDGQGIVNGIKNVWGILKNAKSLGDALSKIGAAVVQGLKNMLKNLVKWGMDKLTGLLNNLVKKFAGWLSDKLGEWKSKANNPIVKKGLEWLQSQADKCKKNGAQKVLSKLSNKVVEKIGTLIDKGCPNNPANKKVLRQNVK